MLMNQSLLMNVMMNNHFERILGLPLSQTRHCLFQCYLYVTTEADTSTFTGIERPEMCKAIFEVLKPKAQVMTY